MHVSRDVLARVLSLAVLSPAAIFHTQKATARDGQMPPNAVSSRTVFARSAQAIAHLKATFTPQTPFPISAEDTSGLVHAEWIERKGDCMSQTIVYFIHGGAFVVGSPQINRFNAYYLSKYGCGRAFSTSYRLAPQHKFPWYRPSHSAL